MQVFLVLLGLVAYAMADTHHDDDACCTLEDRREVMALYQAAWGAGARDHRIVIARAVFDDLFEHDPETKAMFNRVKVDEPDSPEFKAHCVRITNGLDILINLLDEPAVLDAAIAHLGEQHKLRQGMKAEYFEHIGDSFERVFKQVIPCFNSEAFHRCFSGLSHALGAYLE